MTAEEIDAQEDYGFGVMCRLVHDAHFSVEDALAMATTHIAHDLEIGQSDTASDWRRFASTDPTPWRQQVAAKIAGMLRFIESQNYV